MNAGDRQLLIEKCAKSCTGHWWKSEISALVDNTNRIHELADIIHNLPLFQVGRDEFAVVHIGEELQDYESKYGVNGLYTRILDLDEEKFNDAITVLPGIGLHRKNSQ